MLTIQEREIIVRMHEQNKIQEEIASAVGCSQQMVSRWIKRFKDTGSLETRPRSGRPTALTKEVKASLKKKIKAKLEKANESFNGVSTKEIKELIAKEVGNSYSMRHVERIMHDLGFSLIMPRTTHVRHDQEKVNTFRDEFKKNLKKSIWIMK